MATVHIPESMAGAIKELNGIGALLTAKEWERAAIVYAFTTDQQGTNQHQRKSANALGISEFARLGITGLRNHEQVSDYRKAWQSAIDDGQAIPVHPGDDVDLPTVPWKDHFGEPTVDVQARVFRSVVEQPERFAQALRDHPETATALAERVIELPALTTAVEHRLNAAITERFVDDSEPTRFVDYRADLVAGVNKLVPVLRAIRHGLYHTSTTEQMLLHSLSLLLNDAANTEQIPADDLFAAIASHMKGAVR